MDFRVPVPPAGTPDDEVVWYAIERIFTELLTPYEPDRWLDDLTSGQRAVFALDLIRKEVCNGGLDQLFVNSTGYFTPEAIEGADYIAASDYSAILRQAAAIFPDGVVPRDWGERADYIDAHPGLGDLLEPLDDEFFALLHDPTRNLDGLMATFIATHPDEFFSDP